MSALLDVRGAGRVFGGGRSWYGAPRPALHAVSEVSFEVTRGETFGIVGESGCGKSTLARLLSGLDRPTAGAVRLDGGPPRSGAQVQYVFQDPSAALNPRKTIRASLAAPLINLRGLGGAALDARVAELMEAVNLAPDFLDRYPHEVSGGQAQRVGIARALAAEPDLVVLDEPVSALDVSVQAQVLNLLADLRDRFGLTYVFISHDLSVVEAICDRVAVMYFGRIVEVGATADLFRAPRHPYTDLLLRCVPVPGRPPEIDADADTELPDPYAPPPGCAFAPRCPRAGPDCRRAVPDLSGGAHAAACFHPLAPPSPDPRAPSIG